MIGQAFGEESMSRTLVLDAGIRHFDTTEVNKQKKNSVAISSQANYTD
jgi:hypothetical protein